MNPIRPQVQEKIDHLHQEIQRLINNELKVWDETHSQVPLFEKLIQHDRIQKACLPVKMRGASYYSTRRY
jgi:hypothetical protein